MKIRARFEPNSNTAKHHHLLFQTGVNTAWPQRFQSLGPTTSQIIVQSKIDHEVGHCHDEREGRIDVGVFCKLHCGERQVNGESFIFGCTCFQKKEGEYNEHVTRPRLHIHSKNTRRKWLASINCHIFVVCSHLYPVPLYFSTNPIHSSPQCPGQLYRKVVV